MKVRDIAPFGVRLPAELKDKLQESAKKNSRSLNSEIVTRLNLTLLMEEDKSLLLKLSSPDSYPTEAERQLKLAIEEKLPDFLQVMAKQLMTEEYKRTIQELAREEAEKEWKNKNKKPT